jgi:hypothetical protein
MPDWTLMNDLTTGDLVTEADMDALRGNLEYLLDPNHQAIRRDAGNYTTTSTTFVDVDATNLTITLETHGGPVWVGLTGMASINGVGAISYFDVEMDGVRLGSTSPTGAGLVNFTTPSSGTQLNVSFSLLVTGLAAGTHTLKLQWRVSSITVTLYAIATNPMHFSAIEL